MRYLTLRAAGLVRAVDVVAYFAKKGLPGNARGIVAPLLAEGRAERRFEYPMTDEMPAESADYQLQMGAFYRATADALSALLRQGKSVGLLAEGDPFFYGSFMHMWRRLAADFPVEVVPGVTGMSGCWTRANLPITWGNDTLAVLPGTLDEAQLVERLRLADAAVIMKVGRNLGKVRRAVEAAGLLSRAVYVERGTMQDERILPLAQCCEPAGAYFAMVLIPGRGQAAVNGSLVVVGTGPGKAELMTPATQAALARATDLVGYGPYLDRVPARDDQCRHASDNRVELDRARLALSLGRIGPPGRRRVGRRSRRVRHGGGGVRGGRDRRSAWRDLDIRVEPGVTAMLAAAAEVGAPLGGDFCAISLSDNLKAWSTVERRLTAAAEADFVIALYNPASRRGRISWARRSSCCARARRPKRRYCSCAPPAPPRPRSSRPRWVPPTRHAPTCAPSSSSAPARRGRSVAGPTRRAASGRRRDRATPPLPRRWSRYGRPAWRAARS